MAVVPFLRFHTSALALLFFPLLLWAASAAGAEEAPPFRPISADDVRVNRFGDGFRIEMTMVAPVPQEVAWQVLTDFDHMARFIPNLERSAVTHRAGNRLRIEQQGKAYFGPFPIVFGSTREIEMIPMREISARQLTGTAKSMESSMRLSAGADGTQLDYRADIVPDTYLPPLFGPGAVRREMADQFSAIVFEMRQRAATEKR